jgi:stearoyl-CoA desaturase (delta-9 desaturase)
MMAVVTFGEGYHNYHHEFQHDYRNGVKPWQFDPTKWIIWTLSKVGLASKLRRVSEERILLAQLEEAKRHMEDRLQAPHLTQAARAYLSSAAEQTQKTVEAWLQRRADQVEITREMLAELRKDIRNAWRAIQSPEVPEADLTT